MTFKTAGNVRGACEKSKGLALARTSGSLDRGADISDPPVRRGVSMVGRPAPLRTDEAGVLGYDAGTSPPVRVVGSAAHVQLHLGGPVISRDSNMGGLSKSLQTLSLPATRLDGEYPSKLGARLQGNQVLFEHLEQQES